MARTIDLGVIASRMQAVSDQLKGETFKGSAEIVDNHVVLRAEMSQNGRLEAHSEVVPMAQVFMEDKDVLAEALGRLQQWASEITAAA